MKSNKKKNIATELVLDNVVCALKLQREAFESKKDHKQYYQYFVAGTLGGNEVRAFFWPDLNKVEDGDKSANSKFPKMKSDRKSYEQLDNIFGDRSEVDLFVWDDVIQDSKTNTVKEIRKYTAVVTDDTGDHWVDVKPQLNSDKSIVGNLILQQCRADQIAEEEAAKKRAAEKAAKASKDTSEDKSAGSGEKKPQKK